MTVKSELTDRVRSLKEVSSVHARVNAAHRLGAIPNEVSDVCIALNDASPLGGVPLMLTLESWPSSL